MEKNQSEKIKRIDIDEDLRQKILRICRLKYKEIWIDKLRGHRVGVLDATILEDILEITKDKKADIILNDPPYNVVVGSTNTKNLFKYSLDEYLNFSYKWVENALKIMKDDSSLYIWIGADQNDGFQPLADFIIMMRNFGNLKTRSLITMRNQRGYGTQKNWMAVRQELLYYTKGSPFFNIQAEYTDIPKILKSGYYKKINGILTDNKERSKSEFIRAGNVWVDIQQVFYRIEENVPGAYAQKPLKAICRIIEASSKPGDLIADFFSHSGTTLIACEKLNRTCYTFDIDPIFAELTIRRLENFRRTGKPGWQWKNPFPEIVI